MLNRLRKNFREVTTPDGQRQRNAESQGSAAEQTGFICPMCMVNLPSPEALQSHFEQAHPVADPPTQQKQVTETDAAPHSPHADAHGDSNHSSEVKNVSNQGQDLNNGYTPSNGNVKKVTFADQQSLQSDFANKDAVNLKAEVEDLRASLSEEKWYSQELKKEMDSLKDNNLKLLNDIEVVEGQMKIAMATNEELALQKEKLQEKAAEFAKVAADAKAVSDLAITEKESAEEKSNNQTVELEKAATWIRDLESQLLQRPGADDVMVLKRELVQVQTLMDQLTQESEERNKEVEKERKVLQTQLEDARSKALLVKQEFDQFKVENERLKMENVQTAAAKEESTKLYQQQKEELKQFHSDNEQKRQEAMASLQTEVEQQRSLAQSLDVELNLVKAEKENLHNQVNSLKEEMVQLNSNASDERNKISQVRLELDNANRSKSGLEEKLSSLTEQFEECKLQLESTSAESKSTIALLTSERDSAQSQLREANQACEQLKTKSEHLKQRCDELQSTNRELETGSSSTRHQLEIELAQLKIKLESAESDHAQLAEANRDLVSSISSSKAENEQERSETQSKMVELERQLVEFKLQKTHLEESLKTTQSELESHKAQLEESREAGNKLSEKANNLNTELSLKTQEIGGLTEKLTVSQTKLTEETERREAATEDARKLREERGELIAQMEAGEGEAAARAQLADENEKLRVLKEEAEQRLRDEASEHKLTARELGGKLIESATQLSSVQQQLESSLAQANELKAKLAEEHEKLLHHEAELKAKNDVLLSAQAASQSQRADIEGHLRSVQRALEDKQKEAAKSVEELASLRTLADSQKAQINQLKQQLGLELATAKSALEQSEIGRRSAEEESGRKSEELEREREASLLEQQKRKEEMRSLEAKHAEKVLSLENSLLEVTAQLKLNIDNLQKQKSANQETEEMLLQVRNELQASKLGHQEALEQHGNVAAQLRDTKEALSTSQAKGAKEAQERAREVLSRDQRIDDLTKQLREAEQLTNENALRSDHEIKDLSDQLTEERSRRNEAEGGSRDLRTRLGDRQIEVDALKKTLTDVRLRSEEEQNKLSSEICSHLAAISTLEEQLENLKSDVIAKEADVKRLAQQNDDVKEDLEKSRKELQESHENASRIQTRLDELTKQFNSLQLDSQELDRQKSTLDETKLDMERELNEKVEYIRILEAELVEKGEEANESLKKMQMCEMQVKEIEEEKRARMIEWKQHRDHLQSQVKSVQEERDLATGDLVAEREDRDRESSEMKSKLEEMQEEQEKFKTEHEAEKSRLEGRINAMNVAEEILNSHKVELQTKFDELEAKVSRDQLRHEEAQQRFQTAVKEKEERLADLTSQLETTKREMEKQDAERVVSESRLQLEIKALSTNLGSVRSEWATSTQRLDAVQQEKADLKGKIMQLEATVQSNADERRALLERCLNSEQQVEQHRTKLGELQRKLEDAHSAMHELGRENQALQVKHTTTISRQWTDDRTANQCKACSRAFTMTVRRHHCRHCGDIFCSDCSARSATVASSKNPVRVCERCFDELLVAS